MTVAAPDSGVLTLNLDLDGDGVVDPVAISDVPAKEPPGSIVRVELRGKESSTIDFHSYDGLPPNLSVVKIDGDRPERQLLMEIPQLGNCSYYILALSRKKLVSLLDFQSDANCKAPRPQGNGTVEVSTWRGFWWQDDILRLSKDGASLKQETATTYDVWAAGMAKKPIELSGAECPVRVAEPGTFVRVTAYSVAKKEYQLKTSDGGCGWIAEEALSDLVGELPEGD